MAMESVNTGSMRSLSALFDSKAEADRAVAALEAAGVADVVLTGNDNASTGGTQDYSGEARTDRGFFESIGDFFFPEEDRYAYAEGLDRGGYLVTVRNIPEHQYETALDILDSEGAVDLDAREAEWRSEGWTGYSATAGAADMDTTTGTATPTIPEAIPSSTSTAISQSGSSSTALSTARTGSTSAAATRSWRRPRRSASEPAKRATGTIVTCATMT